MIKCIGRLSLKMGVLHCGVCTWTKKCVWSPCVIITQGTYPRTNLGLTIWGKCFRHANNCRNKFIVFIIYSVLMHCKDLLWKYNEMTAITFRLQWTIASGIWPHLCHCRRNHGQWWLNTSVGTSDPNFGSTRYLWPKFWVFLGRGLEEHSKIRVFRVKALKNFLISGRVGFKIGFKVQFFRVKALKK